MKKLLFIHKHFYPDTPPYANMLLDIAKEMSNEGYKVNILTAMPSYKSFKQSVSNENIEGVTVNRLHLVSTFFKNTKLKFLDFFYFPIRVFIYLLFHKYNAITVSTAPPVILGFLVALICRLKNTKLIYHCMDIHPEIGRISGEFSNNYVFRFLRFLDNFTLNTAYKTIVLSDDMIESINERNSSTNIIVINNFALKDNNEHKIKTIKHVECGKVKILFAGNVGRYQGLESLVLAFNQLPNDVNLELLFLGDGQTVSVLKELSKHENIQFSGHVTIDEAKLIMSQSDFGIVSLQENIINFAYPSKIMTYLEQGIPLIALVENSSALSKFIDVENIGFHVENDDIESILDLLNNISRLSDNVGFTKEHIVDVYNNNFHFDCAMKKWKKIFSEI
ncbi:glycosyltransferase family 4 protein [Vibrio diabolicus]|uniref:glycosyltransferase family 4 protein n=1 Tax=Vibrio diabolicus TaxID=50719 RepID=UPI0015F4FCBB|nr:glycosyltransferase family 4 protein [Vibrio diabolicus]